MERGKNLQTGRGVSREKDEEAHAGTRSWQEFPGETSGRNLWLEKVAETGLTE